MTTHRIYDADAEVHSVAHHLWSVKNCFGKETFQELSATHLNHTDAWHRHADCLEYRLQLTPESPTLTRLHDTAPEIMPELVRLTCI
jgi:hypothetical protein